MRATPAAVRRRLESEGYPAQRADLCIRTVYVPKPAKQKQKKIIYKEVEEEKEEEEEIVYIYINKPKPQQQYNGDMPLGRETLDRTLYKSSTEQLHMRAVEERIRHNLTSCYSALMPREY